MVCKCSSAGLSEYRSLFCKLHINFEELVGDADANALLSGVSSGDDALVSLGLLMGLLAVSRGEVRHVRNTCSSTAIVVHTSMEFSMSAR